MPTVYAALRDALFRLDGNGPERRLDGHDLECVSLHPDAPDRVFCGTFDDGLYRSRGTGCSPKAHEQVRNQIIVDIYQTPGWFPGKIKQFISLQAEPARIKSRYGHIDPEIRPAARTYHGE